MQVFKFLHDIELYFVLQAKLVVENGHSDLLDNLPRASIISETVDLILLTPELLVFSVSHSFCGFLLT